MKLGIILSFVLLGTIVVLIQADSTTQSEGSGNDQTPSGDANGNGSSQTPPTGKVWLNDVQFKPDCGLDVGGTWSVEVNAKENPKKLVLKASLPFDDAQPNKEICTLMLLENCTDDADDSRLLKNANKGTNGTDDGTDDGQEATPNTVNECTCSKLPPGDDPDVERFQITQDAKLEHSDLNIQAEVFDDNNEKIGTSEEKQLPNIRANPRDDHIEWTKEVDDGDAQSTEDSEIIETEKKIKFCAYNVASKYQFIRDGIVLTATDLVLEAAGDTGFKICNTMEFDDPQNIVFFINEKRGCHKENHTISFSITTAKGASEGSSKASTGRPITTTQREAQTESDEPIESAGTNLTGNKYVLLLGIALAAIFGKWVIIGL